MEGFARYSEILSCRVVEAAETSELGYHPVITLFSRCRADLSGPFLLASSQERIPFTVAHSFLAVIRAAVGRSVISLVDVGDDDNPFAMNNIKVVSGPIRDNRFLT